MQKRSLKAFTLTFLLSLFSATASATTAGFYMGLMAGPATNEGTPQNAQVKHLPGQTKVVLTQVKPRGQQFASRAYMGYQMNNYAAFELGFTFFSSINYNQTFPNVTLCSSASARVRNIEVMGKGILPFYYFDIFGKAGVSFTYLSVTGALNPELNLKKDILCGRSVYNVIYNPSFAIGASYNINQRWVTDLTFGTILTSRQPKRVNYVALGLSFHFVDIYCGQFLCD